MRKRVLGRTGLEVSELSLGTAELGLDYGIAPSGQCRRPEESEAIDLLRFALDIGINLIDTSHDYGHSERIIARALKDRRKEFFLVSKARPAPQHPHEVRRQLEGSLRSLEMESIDLMLLHCGVNEVKPDPESTGELERLRQEGKIRFIGSSVYGPSAALEAIDCGWFDCVQIAYSVLDRRAETAVLDSAARQNIGIMARSVLLKGALTKRYKLLDAQLAPLKKCVEQLADIAGSLDALPSFAYRYVLRREPPHSVLVGTSNPEELRACVAYSTMGPLSDIAVVAAQTVNLEHERWFNPGAWPSTDWPS